MVNKGISGSEGEGRGINPRPQRKSFRVTKVKAIAVAVNFLQTFKIPASTYIPSPSDLEPDIYLC